MEVVVYCHKCGHKFYAYVRALGDSVICCSCYHKTENYLERKEHDRRVRAGELHNV